MSTQCEYESAREDSFLDIPLVIKPFGANTTHGSVVSCLSKSNGYADMQTFLSHTVGRSIECLCSARNAGKGQSVLL